MAAEDGDNGRSRHRHDASLDHYRAILKHSKHLPGIKEPVLHHEKKNEPTNWLLVVLSPMLSA